MHKDSTITVPISYNRLKHHMADVVEYLAEASSADILKLIESINHNNVDLYSGRYPVEVICRMIISELGKKGVLDKEAYNKWVISGGGYQEIILEDKSVWILSKGEDNTRYIHIHPAKYGPCSVRFKGATLKTVYHLKSSYQNIPVRPSLELINAARLQIGLSPVKRLVLKKGILKCWEFFNLPRNN